MAVIANCKTHDPKADSLNCSECSNGFVANLDFTICLVAISNCDTHITTADSITCESCLTGFIQNLSST